MKHEHEPDYLFDPQAEADVELQKLENALAPLRYGPRSFDPATAAGSPSPRKIHSGGARRFVVPLIAAAASWVIGVGLWSTRQLQETAHGDPAATASPMVPSTAPSDAPPAFHVVRESGTPTIAGELLAAQGSLREGTWLETDQNSRARIQVASIGTVKVSPDSRVQLVRTRGNEHRLALDRGRIDAVVVAPPRLFIVDTPSAAAVDLGCAYHLVVRDDGATLLHVDSGQVSLEGEHHQAWVPAGAECVTKKGFGPGTPSFSDSGPAFRRALEAYDWERGSLGAVLREARSRDTLSLVHLLARVSPNARANVAARIRELAPKVRVPETNDAASLLELREALSRTW